MQQRRAIKKVSKQTEPKNKPSESKDKKTEESKPDKQKIVIDVVDEPKPKKRAKDNGAEVQISETQLPKPKKMAKTHLLQKRKIMQRT